MSLRGRSFTVFALASALVWLTGGAAFAAAPHGQTVTFTDHMHGTWVETGDINPCNGHDLTVTVTGNAVSHVTYFTNSDEFWATFTETGFGTATDNGVVYSGHFTVWGNENVNERNANSTFTFSLKLTGSDGSVVSGHEVAHVAWSANPGVTAPTVSFDKMSFVCG